MPNSTMIKACSRKHDPRAKNTLNLLTQSTDVKGGKRIKRLKAIRDKDYLYEVLAF